MTFDHIYSNPPYNLGGKITKATLNSLTDDGKCVCLMPLAQYKGYVKEADPLYRYIVVHNEADNEMFEDADIVNNLCVCVLGKRPVDNYTWNDLIFKSFDKNFLPFYQINTKSHYRFLVRRNATYNDFDVNLDFVETNRFVSSSSGSGFGKGGFGYSFNVLKNNETCIAAGSAYVHFKTSKMKDNFAKWWYLDKKGKSLSSMLMLGLNIGSVSSKTAIAIPQIDWESISDHPLWKQGDYDGAVLDVMGLEWADEDKTRVVKK